MKKHFFFLAAFAALLLLAGGGKAGALTPEPYVTWDPQSLQYPVGTDAVYFATVSGQDLTFTWTVEYGGKDYELPADKDKLMNAGMKDQCDDVVIHSTANRSQITFTNVRKDIGLKDGKFTKVTCNAFDGSFGASTNYAYVSCNGMSLSAVTMPPRIYLKPVVALSPDATGKIAVTVTPYDESAVSGIEYQWYEYTGGELMANIQAIEGENGPVLVADVDFGDFRDYLVGVFLKLKNGNEIVAYSSPVNVYRLSGDIDHSWDQLIIRKEPDRLRYTLGDKPDLTGLEAEYIADGESKGIVPIASLETDITEFTYAGPVRVTVGYQGKTNGFTVWVDPKDGSWEIDPSAEVPATAEPSSEEITTAEPSSEEPSSEKTTEAETSAEEPTQPEATETEPETAGSVSTETPGGSETAQTAETTAQSAEAPASTAEAAGNGGGSGNTVLIVLIIVMALIIGLLAGLLIGGRKQK